MQEILNLNCGTLLPWFLLLVAIFLFLIMRGIITMYRYLNFIKLESRIHFWFRKEFIPSLKEGQIENFSASKKIILKLKELSFEFQNNFSSYKEYEFTDFFVRRMDKVKVEGKFSFKDFHAEKNSNIFFSFMLERKENWKIKKIYFLGTK